MSGSANLFSHWNLGGIDYGSDDFGSAIKEGFASPDFARLIVLLASEISVLYELSEEETLTAPSSKDSLTSFLYDLSAFLAQIDCPYDSLCCGKIEERFVTEGARQTLVSFLLDEVRSARLTAAQHLEQPSMKKESPLAAKVAAAARAVGVSTIDPKTTAVEYLIEINQRVSKLGKPRPSPLFTAALERHRWPAIECIAKRIGHDFRLRNLYLLKRLEVTMDSFLFNHEIRKKEKLIVDLMAGQKNKLARYEPPGVVDLLAASQRHLIIRKSSSRPLVRSVLHPSALSEAPASRGGMPAAEKEFPHITRNMGQKRKEAEGEERKEMRRNFFNGSRRKEGRPRKE